MRSDGAFVKQAAPQSRPTKTFKGFSDNGSTREFLFALPRYQRIHRRRTRW